MSEAFDDGFAACGLAGGCIVGAAATCSEARALFLVSISKASAWPPLGDGGRDSPRFVSIPLLTLLATGRSQTCLPLPPAHHPESACVDSAGWTSTGTTCSGRAVLRGVQTRIHPFSRIQLLRESWVLGTPATAASAVCSHGATTFMQ